MVVLDGIGKHVGLSLAVLAGVLLCAQHDGLAAMQAVDARRFRLVAPCHHASVVVRQHHHRLAFQVLL